jgi:spore coat polysaccharide biosynthesis predicted glycosyltransferase SpsG/RimJ/RimL family protein N-acetyltransferase
VLDGYPFDGTYQGVLKRAGLRVLSIDDEGKFETYAADLILNQNISAGADMYKGKASGSRLLLGTRYAMLGQQFLHKQWSKHLASRTVKTILVTYGAADPLNLTLKTLQALDTLAGDFSVDAVVGGVNIHRTEIESFARSMRRPARIILDAKNMPELMERCDLAIAAAGTTPWELLYLGVPFVTGAFAKNQKQNAKDLGERGLALNAGWYPDLSVQELAKVIGTLLSDGRLREQIAGNGKGIVDGKGADRACDAMEAPNLVLRRATERDDRLLFAWANDPVTRAAAFSTGQIPWEDHVRWLAGKLNDPSCVIYVAEADGVPIGQIRFDREGNHATIDVHLAPEHRSKGFGQALIRSGVETYFSESDATQVHAYAKQENTASYGAFLKAGFTDAGTATLRGMTVHHVFFERP